MSFLKNAVAGWVTPGESCRWPGICVKARPGFPGSSLFRWTPWAALASFPCLSYLFILKNGPMAGEITC